MKQRLVAFTCPFFPPLEQVIKQHKKKHLSVCKHWTKFRGVLFLYVMTFFSFCGQKRLKSEGLYIHQCYKQVYKGGTTAVMAACLLWPTTHTCLY